MKRRDAEVPFRAFLSAFISLVCATPLAAAAQTLVPWVQGATLGKGYDLGSGALIDIECINWRALPERQIRGAGTQDGLLFREIVTREELKSSLVMAANASAKFTVVNASAKMRFSESVSISRHDATVLLQYRVTSAEQGLLLESASPLKTDYQRRTSDPLDFRKYCGTHYVSSISTGGELIMTLQSGIREWKSRKAFTAAVRGAAGAYAANVKVDQSQEKSLKNSDLTIVGRKAGGADTIAYSLDLLREELKTFRQQVLDRADRKDVVLYATLTPYPGVNFDADPKAVAVENASEVLILYGDKLATLNDVLQRPDAYDIEPTTIDRLDSEISRLRTARDDLRLDIAACLDPSTQAGLLRPNACQNLGKYPRPPLDQNDTALPEKLSTLCVRTDIVLSPMTIAGAKHIRGDGHLGPSSALIKLSVETRLVDQGRQLRGRAIKRIEETGGSRNPAEFELHEKSIDALVLWRGDGCIIPNDGVQLPELSSAEYRFDPSPFTPGIKQVWSIEGTVDRVECWLAPNSDIPNRLIRGHTVDCTIHFASLRNVPLVSDDLIQGGNLRAKKPFDRLAWLP